MTIGRETMEPYGVENLITTTRTMFVALGTRFWVQKTTNTVSIPFSLTAISTVDVQIGEWEYNKVIVFHIIFIVYLWHNVLMHMCNGDQYLQDMNSSIGKHAVVALAIDKIGPRPYHFRSSPVWNWADFMKAEADNGQGADDGCQM